MQIVRSSPSAFIAIAPAATRAAGSAQGAAAAGGGPRLGEIAAGPEASGGAPELAATLAARSDPLQDPAVQRVIAELSARDREVRAHEQAHVAAGGELITAGPNYVYQTGPDRRRYAVGGEVGIDTSPVRGDPEATLDKAARIVAAALAPAEPSSQDYRVAAQANQMAAQARLELVQQRARQAYGEISAERPGSGTAAGLSLRV